MGFAHLDWHEVSRKLHWELRKLCEDDDFGPKNLIKVVPVYSNVTRMFYKNIHCAKCNYEPVDHIISFDPEFVCPNVNEAGSVYHTSTPDSFITYLLSTCTMHIDYQQFPFPLSRSNCGGEPVAMRCGKSHELYNLCMSYTTYFSRSGNLPLRYRDPFKNAFCKMCYTDEPPVCASEPLPDPDKVDAKSVTDVGSFTVLMDFNSGSGILFTEMPVCLKNESLNPVLNKCFPRFCPSSMIGMNGTCYHLNITRNLVTPDVYHNKVDVYVESTQDAISDPNPGDLIDKFSVKIKFESYNLDKSAIVSSTEGKSCKDIAFASIHCRSLIVIHLTVYVFDANVWLNIMFQIHSSVLEIAMDLALDVCQVSFLNYDASTTQHCSTKHSFVWSKEVSMHSEIIGDYKQTDAIKLAIKESDLLYNPNTAAVQMSWSHDYVTDDQSDKPSSLRQYKLKFWNLSVEAGVCYKHLAFCEKIILHDEMYEARGVDDQTIQVIFKISELHTCSIVPSDELMFVNGSLLVVCVKYLLEALPLSDVHAVVQSWLTVIGMILSITALFFTVITLLLFPELRNIPGEIVIRLSVALALAQFFFLIRSLVLGVDIICKVTAVLQHCFWLMAFGWMNVFAIDVSATFVYMYISGSPLEPSRMRRYDAYGWSVPVLFVAVCNVVEHVGPAGALEYGGQSCWISPSRTLIYVFGLPLAVILLINMACFVSTVVVFKKTRKLVKAAIDKERAEDNRVMVVASVKLCTVMGLTWVSGFLANIPSLWVIWYMFIVLNTLQGFMLTVSFVCNVRVWRHYKLFARTRSRSLYRTTRATKSTNIHSRGTSSKNRNTDSKKLPDIESVGEVVASSCE